MLYEDGTLYILFTVLLRCDLSADFQLQIKGLTESRRCTAGKKTQKYNPNTPCDTADVA